MFQPQPWNQFFVQGIVYFSGECCLEIRSSNGHVHTHTHHACIHIYTHRCRCSYVYMHKTRVCVFGNCIYLCILSINIQQTYSLCVHTSILYLFFFIFQLAISKYLSLSLKPQVYTVSFDFYILADFSAINIYLKYNQAHLFGFILLQDFLPILFDSIFSFLSIWKSESQNIHRGRLKALSLTFSLRCSTLSYLLYSHLLPEGTQSHECSRLFHPAFYKINRCLFSNTFS